MKHDGSISKNERVKACENLQGYLTREEARVIAPLDLSAAKLEAILEMKKINLEADVITFARKRTEGLDGSE